MELKLGCVVISKAGRDKGRPLYVANIDDDYIYVCDGKERPLERPKRKNPKHISAISKTLNKDEVTGNRALRKTLQNVLR